MKERKGFLKNIKFKDIKKLRVEYEKNSNDEVEINVHLTSIEEQLLSPFCTKKESILHPDLANYVEGHNSVIPLYEKICLNFVLDEYSKENVSYIESSWKHYYKQIIQISLMKLKKNNLYSFVMFFVGLIVFAIAIVFKTLNLNLIFLETIDIMGWVFIWEAIDLFFIQRYLIRNEITKKYRLLSCPLKFIESIEEK